MLSTVLLVIGVFGLLYALGHLAAWMRAVDESLHELSDTSFEHGVRLVSLEQRLRFPLKTATVTRDEPQHLASCAAYQGSYFIAEKCNCMRPNGAA